MLSTKYVQPRAPVCISQFLPLQSTFTAPWRGTFKGTVASLGMPDVTANLDNPTAKRNFHLVDNFGTWFRCTALGRNANNNALKEGQEVVLYFVTARPKVGSSPATAFLMRDAVIVPLQNKKGLVTKKVELVIK